MNLRLRNAASIAGTVVLFVLAEACGSSSSSTPPDLSGTTGSSTTSSSGQGGGSGTSTSASGGASTGSGSGTTSATGGAGPTSTTSTTTTTGTGGSGTGGAPPGGPKVDVPPGDPITATPMMWTAVPVAGSICRDKQATGFGVNIAPGSTKLLIYMEGGGACFNATTCTQAPSSWAPNDTTLGAAVGANALFNRTSSVFKDWNFAYIPYCSGDVFTGTTMSGYMGQPQMGYQNYFKFLQRMLGTFKGLTQVVLSGSSAGGFGIAYNWMLTQDAFGSVPVFALDDSGPPMSPDYLAQCQEQKVGALWGWKDSVHPACTTCDVANGKVTRPLLQTALARAMPGTRFALTSYDEDGIIKTFFAYGNNNCAGWDALIPPTYPTGKYPMGLAELRTAWMSANFAAMYVVKGGGHTFLAGDLTRIKTGTGATMADWIKQFADGTAGWTNVVP